VVLDTNVMLRALANRASDSARILRACDRRKMLLLLSKPVMDEYRAVLTNEEIIERHPAITPEAVKITLRRLRYVSDYLRLISARFRFTRDPRDEKFVELAIAGDATHLISFDNDLLSLAEARTDDAKRFRQRLPSGQVIRPGDFINANAELFEDVA
jgi:putative PIN family toxin of toxin-antitoxin system